MMKREYEQKFELKIIGGNDCQYAAKDIWDKKRKKAVQETSLIGSIDERELTGRGNQRGHSNLSGYTNMETHNLYGTLHRVCIRSWKRHPYRNGISTIAIVKALDRVLLRFIQSRFQKLFASRKFQIDLDPDDLSNIFGYVLYQSSDQYEMFRKITEYCVFHFYDMTSVIS